MKFKRTETEYMGGDTVCNTYLPKQRVHVVKQHASPGGDEDEDDMWLVSTADGKRFVVDGCDLRPHPEEPELNTEFVVRLMEWGNPMVQGFVLEAIESYSRQVLTMSEEARARMDRGMIRYATWQDCAQQCLGLIVARDVERAERNKKASAPAG